MVKAVWDDDVKLQRFMLWTVGLTSFEGGEYCLAHHQVVAFSDISQKPSLHAKCPIFFWAIFSLASEEKTISWDIWGEQEDWEAFSSRVYHKTSFGQFSFFVNHRLGENAEKREEGSQ